MKKEFAGNGRVLIRPSGTEPLVRVMIEGEDQEYITKKAKEIANLIEKKIEIVKIYANYLNYEKNVIIIMYKLKQSNFAKK